MVNPSPSSGERKQIEQARPFAFHHCFSQKKGKNGSFSVFQSCQKKQNGIAAYADKRVKMRRYQKFLLASSNDSVSRVRTSTTSQTAGGGRRDGRAVVEGRADVQVCWSFKLGEPGAMAGEERSLELAQTSWEQWKQRDVKWN